MNIVADFSENNKQLSDIIISDTFLIGACMDGEGRRMVVSNRLAFPFDDYLSIVFQTNGQPHCQDPPPGHLY